MIKAMCLFLRRRDTAAALRATYQARTDGDVTWRYNVAFLEAYVGNLDNSEAEYERAFKGPLVNVTVPIQCEEFIHLVLEQEPTKVQLHYCSGLINYFAKRDTVGALSDLSAFVSKAEGKFPVQVRRAREILAQLQPPVAPEHTSK